MRLSGIENSQKTTNNEYRLSLHRFLSNIKFKFKLNYLIRYFNILIIIFTKIYFYLILFVNYIIKMVKKLMDKFCTK